MLYFVAKLPSSFHCLEIDRAGGVPTGLRELPEVLSLAKSRHRFAKSRKTVLLAGLTVCSAFCSHSIARTKQYSDVWGDD